MTTALEIPVHIPACVLCRQPDPAPSLRDLAVHLQGDDFKIGIWIPTPASLQMGGYLQAIRQTQIIGEAVLKTLEDAKPRFHYSIVDGHRALTLGTTIAITARTRDDTSTIVATWDYGEPITQPMRRINALRRFLDATTPELAVTILERLLKPNLTPPQVMLSNVMMLDDPDMALGSAPGSAPIAIAVGRQRTHIVFDHRLYDPPDEAAFASALVANLASPLLQTASGQTSAQSPHPLPCEVD